MRAAIVENGSVQNVVRVPDESFAQERGWIVSDAANIGDTYDESTGEFTSLPAPQVQLGQMTTDKHEITADSEDAATVSITAPDTVHFVVDGDLYSVEPENDTATLEITADAPGPIRVEMQNQSLMIVALEVSQ